jgi:hypothetical protein
VTESLMKKAAQRRHRRDRIANALHRGAEVSFDFLVGFGLGQVPNVQRGFRHDFHL